MAIQVVFFDIGNTLVLEKKWLPGAHEALDRLLATKIRVGLISNTGQLSREELSQQYLPEDFLLEQYEQGLVFLSSEVGVEKPARGIFSLAVQHSNVSPWETMFVGEDLTETLVAQSAGMQAARIADPKVDYPKLIKNLLG